MRLPAGLPDRGDALAHRRDGSGDGGPRRVGSTGVHDLQGTAHRRAAGPCVAACSSRRSCRSKISASTITTASTSVRIAVGGAGQRPPRRAAQGGSTITQQLARQSFLTPDKTIRRKVQELILAARIERPVSRRIEILELYLNKVYFGDGLYGVEAASRGYLRQACLRAVSLPEAALLAGSREVAVELRADGEPGSRDGAPQRRAAGDARRTASSIAGRRGERRRRRGSRCTTACAPKSRTASTSRSRCAASSSSGSAGSACTRAGCACTRRSTCRCRPPPRPPSPSH